MADGKQSTTSDKVKANADQLVGQAVVGTGECYDLADKVLQDAGAKSAPDFGEITADADYVWGTAVSDLKLVQPGDVLQFRDHQFTVRTDITTTITYPDGSEEETEEWDEKVFKRGHHTSVVSATSGNGVMTVVEQHVLDRSTGQLSKVVKTNTLHVQPSTTSKTETSTKTVPGKGQAKVQVVTKVTITVKGTIWAYRPVQR